jgi:putative endonuclease
MYSAHVLVWYEHIPTALEAIAAEKHIKGLTRAKKVAMIRELNPRWKDLSEGWYD